MSESANFSSMTDADLASKLSAQRSEFTSKYSVDASNEELDALVELADSIESLSAEVSRRETRDAKLSVIVDGASFVEGVELAGESSEVPDAEVVESDEVADETAEEATEEAAEEVEEAAAEEAEVAEPVEEVVVETAEEEPTALAASADEVPTNKIALSNIRRAPLKEKEDVKPSIKDVIQAAPDVPGFANGDGMDFSDIAKAIGSRLQGFNRSMYANAADKGNTVRHQNSLFTVRKPAQHIVASTDPAEVDRVLSAATDEKSLPQGSLVASGGWCAPSEVLYDVCELETRDGVYDIPEVTVTRGGLQIATAPNFATLYSQIGFQYTEAQDIAGTYGPAGAAGDKPCFTVECPTFTDYRLDAVGLCISAGLLQARAYPEYLERIIRGALVAHDHRIGAAKLAKVVAGSTVVDFPANQVGAAAPILNAVEIQVEHLRASNRLSRSASVEAVFPHWARGAIRADLSRRLGVDLLAVTDAQIDAWFANRGVRAQYVYGLQDLDGTAAATLAYPAQLEFLLYPAGTWVAGVSDIISIDSLYDSTLLAQNDFTALFTEEGLLVAKRCADSRVVSVGICPDGATAQGVDIACNGTAVAAPAAG